MNKSHHHILLSIKNSKKIINIEGSFGFIQALSTVL